ncbi:MAG: hypothetical protein FJY76_00990 [Candidatus Aenigmarchaeota archaeon]|nr:hypothetical protein [Candidatus Aenigmarchaeota archaeon]
MVTPIEIGVYTIALTTSVIATLTFFIAARRFVAGEFKYFISWVLAASTAFLLGSLLNLCAVILSGTPYGPTFLVVAGFAFVLMGACFIRAAFILHDISKVFGFAWMEKDFGKITRAHARLKKKR